MIVFALMKHKGFIMKIFQANTAFIMKIFKARARGLHIFPAIKLMVHKLRKKKIKYEIDVVIDC